MRDQHRQSWRQSATESVAQVGVGFGIAWAAWEWLVQPMIDHGAISVDDGLTITCIFTIVSLARSFIVRRAAVMITDMRLAAQRRATRAAQRAVGAQGTNKRHSHRKARRRKKKHSDA